MALTLEFDDTQQGALFDLLGIPTGTDVTVDALLEVLADALDHDDQDEPQPSNVAAIANRLGMDVIDSDSLAALRRDADEGRRLAAEAARTKVETLVDNAIRRGKITPARRKHWVTLITNDAALGDTLNAIPDETAIPLTEIGHGIDDDGDDLTQPAPWFR